MSGAVRRLFALPSPWTLEQARGALEGARGRHDHHLRRFEACCDAHRAVCRAGVLDAESLRELAFGIEALLARIHPARREVERFELLVRNLERAERRTG